MCFWMVVVPLGQWTVVGRAADDAAIDGCSFDRISVSRAAQSRRLRASAAVYNATGGFYSYGAGGEIEYIFNRQWQVTLWSNASGITNSAANSPLVTMRGSPNQFTFGLGATYTFTMHPLW